MIKLLLLLLISAPAFAKTEREIGFGSYSYHLLGNREEFQKFSHKVNSSGALIQNNMLTYKKTEIEDDGGYTSFAGFAGANSVGTLMSGFMLATGFEVTDYFRTGLVYGAYAQDNVEFMRRGLGNPTAYFPNDNISVIPILGVELIFKAKVSDHIFMKLNNVITPAVTNHTVSIGVEF